MKKRQNKNAGTEVFKEKNKNCSHLEEKRSEDGNEERANHQEVQKLCHHRKFHRGKEDDDDGDVDDDWDVDDDDGDVDDDDGDVDDDDGDVDDDDGDVDDDDGDVDDDDVEDVKCCHRDNQASSSASQVALGKSIENK